MLTCNVTWLPSLNIVHRRNGDVAFFGLRCSTKRIYLLVVSAVIDDYSPTVLRILEKGTTSWEPIAQELFKHVFTM